MRMINYIILLILFLYLIALKILIPLITDLLFLSDLVNWEWDTILFLNI